LRGREIGGKSAFMAGDRSEAAVQRIEAALARIARAADAPAPTPAAAPANVLALVEKHESLREKVAQAIAELDDVIAGLEL
jgi:7-keto-8-aminopelargonate synthetase-like enzyme